MTGLGSTSEATNTKRRFTVVRPPSRNLTISPYNNEHSPCSTTPSCPKLNVEGQVFLAATNGMLNPTTSHKLPKFLFKPIVVAYPTTFDDDLGMDKIAQGTIILTFKSYMTNEHEQGCTPICIKNVLGKAFFKFQNLRHQILLVWVDCGLMSSICTFNQANSSTINQSYRVILKVICISMNMIRSVMGD